MCIACSQSIFSDNHWQPIAYPAEPVPAASLSHLNAGKKVELSDFPAAFSVPPSSTSLVCRITSDMQPANGFRDSLPLKSSSFFRDSTGAPPTKST